MDSDSSARKTPGSDGGLSDQERAALVGEWRKNRPDLSWKPLEGRELDRFLPLWNKLLAAAVFGTMLLGVVFIVFLLSRTSTQSEVREIEGTIMVAGKLDEDGTARVVVIIPGQEPKMMTYRGTKVPKEGQQVVLEEFDNPLFPWKNYRLKDTD